MIFKAVTQTKHSVDDDIYIMKQVDIYMSSGALVIYMVLLVILLIVRKGRIDNSAKIICIGYPVGVIA